MLVLEFQALGLVHIQWITELRSRNTGCRCRCGILLSCFTSKVSSRKELMCFYGAPIFATATLETPSDCLGASETIYFHIFKASA